MITHQTKMITNLVEKRGLILLVGPSIPMKTSSCRKTSLTPCWMIRFRTLFLTRLVLLRTKNSSNRTYFSKTLQFFAGLFTIERNDLSPMSSEDHRPENHLSVWSMPRRSRIILRRLSQKSLWHGHTRSVERSQLVVPTL